jgi:hypothetical protein
MKKLTTLILTISTLFLINNTAFASDGKLRIKANIVNADIYIDGARKGVTEDEKYADFLLSPGKYNVEVIKKIDEWNYYQQKTISITSSKAFKTNFKLVKSASEKLKTKLKLYDEKRKEILNKSNTKYVDNNDGTITDKTTKLMWKKCSEGQTWKGSTCVGVAKKFNWNNALEHSGDVNTAGYFDWRLPTIKELNTLVFCSNGKKRKLHKDGFSIIRSEGGYGCKSNIKGEYAKPVINKNIFPNTPVDIFWSNSTSPRSQSIAWIVDFIDGSTEAGYPNYSTIIRLVRNGE